MLTTTTITGSRGHRARRAAAAIAGLGTLLTLGFAPTAQAGETHTSDRSQIAVTSDGVHVRFSSAAISGCRAARFDISGSGAYDVMLFRLRGGATLDRVRADLAEEFGPGGAKGTRDLTHDMDAVGLAQASDGRHLQVTTTLVPGTYYAADLSAVPQGGTPSFTKLKVTPCHGQRGDDGDDEGEGEGGGRQARATIDMTSADTFVVRGRVPAQGTIRVRNVSDTLHFVLFMRVRPGTTDAQVQSYLESGQQGPPPFALPDPSFGTDVLSPGRSELLTYKATPGTYVLLCFVADDVSGMPHAMMGMHKVVVLR